MKVNFRFLMLVFILSLLQVLHRHEVQGMESVGCIQKFQVDALTGTGSRVLSNGGDPDLAIQISGQWYFAAISGTKIAGRLLELQILLNQFSPALLGCIAPDDIERVNIIARSSDEWLVTSVNTSTFTGNMTRSNLLTSNPNLNKFVKTDGAYSYDSMNISLTRPILDPNCINTLLIRVQTGEEARARFSSVNGSSHYIAFQLTDGRVLMGELRSPAEANELYESYLDFAHEFDAEGDCIQVSNVSEVRLVAGNENGWLIDSIATKVRVGDEYVLLTSDPVFRLWLDGVSNVQTYNTTQHVLHLFTMDAVKCIEYIEVRALTGTLSHASSRGIDPDLAIQVFGLWHCARVSGSKNAGQLLELLISLHQFRPALLGCITPDDVQRVNLIARGTDGWLVASINISSVVANMNVSLLTSNPNLNKFVETDGAHHSYDSFNISLTRPILGANCISTLLISVQNGDDTQARFSSQNGNSHNITLWLADGRIITGEIRPNFELVYYDFAHEFGVGDCIEISDITEVRLVAGITDGWLIASIVTQVRVGNDFVVLTSDPDFNLWLSTVNEDQGYDTTQHTLHLRGSDVSDVSNEAE